MNDLARNLVIAGAASAVCFTIFVMFAWMFGL